MQKKEPKYIDVHGHVNFKAFDEDRDAVIKRALDNDTWMINVGTQVGTSKAAIDLAHKYSEGVYAIVGLHPIHTGKSFHDKQELGGEGEEFTSKGEVFDKNIYREFLKDEKVVAIGECGLDYYHLNEESKEKQKKAFIEQIELANEIGKPLMLHIRDAYADALEILKEYSKVKGVVHFFVGNVEEAKSFLDFGFMLSFTGVLTFPPKADQPRSDTLHEVVRITPLDMILADTDCPYVAPVPYRGKRNEPLYVKEIVKRIAEIKNLPEEEVAEAIVQNAKRVFGI
jgi:TatD DNase family protein